MKNWRHKSMKKMRSTMQLKTNNTSNSVFNMVVWIGATMATKTKATNVTKFHRWRKLLLSGLMTNLESASWETPATFNASRTDDRRATSATLPRKLEPRRAAFWSLASSSVDVASCGESDESASKSCVSCSGDSNKFAGEPLKQTSSLHKNISLPGLLLKGAAVAASSVTSNGIDVSLFVSVATLSPCKLRVSGTSKAELASPGKLCFSSVPSS
mmetsp:Transcript_78754/g.204630  ORF Transcript_78754/g.204630 Transcript_78754/m.204630 type:complete len:214 (+) Transcript_78754:761-1402(+)